jgi:aromatic ring-opening dioxygenase catalytic subunit (LigB family)
MTAPNPKMYYDYYGFPPAAYSITWPAPGAPQLAERVRQLLSEAGLPSAEDANRGFDHGTFVPLKVSWPDATIPTTQLSLVAGLDPARHLEIGRALAPLRDEGVLILGSGLSFHNLRAFGHPQVRDLSRAFDAWLRDTVARPDGERDASLIAWESAPYARVCHPREEHLLPLMVCAGASAGDVGTVPFNDVLLGTWVSAVHWG